MAGPLNQPRVWNLVADGYNKITADFPGAYADQALQEVTLQPDMRVVDVACGPGTACLPLHDRVGHIDALDFSADMLACLRQNMAARGITNITPVEGDGQNLPFADDSYDLYLSMFGLMFFPDRDRGLAEARRVLQPGGLALISSWAPMDRSPLMQTLMGAQQAGNPDLRPPPADSGAWDRPETIRAAAEKAGFSVESIRPMTLSMAVNNGAEFWNSFTKGSPPVVLMREQQSPEEWQATESAALAWLEKRLPEPTRLDTEALITLLKNS